MPGAHPLKWGESAGSVSSEAKAKPAQLALASQACPHSCTLHGLPPLASRQYPTPKATDRAVAGGAAGGDGADGGSEGVGGDCGDGGGEGGGGEGEGVQGGERGIGIIGGSGARLYWPIGIGLSAAAFVAK
eukprot:scaffold88891_cov55-Phaeocystis_antarctica.AAC.7